MNAWPCFTLACLALLPACLDDERGGHDADDADEVRTSSSAAGSGGGGGGDAETVGTSVGSTATAGGGTNASGTAGAGGAESTGSGSTGTGGASPEGALWPLSIGASWTYEVQEIGDWACASGEYDETVVGTSTLDGLPALEVTSMCTGQLLNSHFAVGEGDIVYFHDGEWLTHLDAPVEQGHTWAFGSITKTWHFEGEVTVPAGTFTDCWRSERNAANYSAYDIYCRGVGRVRAYFEDLSGDGMDAVLMAYQL